MEQFTQPVEGQNDGQETAADHPLQVKAGRIRLNAHFFPFRGLTIGANHKVVKRVLDRPARSCQQFTYVYVRPRLLFRCHLAPIVASRDLREKRCTLFLAPETFMRNVIIGTLTP